MTDKYIVFKREDINRLLTETNTFVHRNGVWSSKLELDDAVVLRLQDVFTEPALHVYATSIAAFIQLLKDTHYGDQDAIDNLQKIADYFEGKAQEAVDFVKRLPTL